MKFCSNIYIACILLPKSQLVIKPEIAHVSDPKLNSTQQFIVPFLHDKFIRLSLFFLYSWFTGEKLVNEASQTMLEHSSRVKA